jgi:Fe2+ transport system protein B
MYGWIWRHLPGNTPVRALISLVLALGIVFLLFQYIFPWAEPLLPFNDVTVNNGAAGAGS